MSEPTKTERLGPFRQVAGSKGRYRVVCQCGEEAFTLWSTEPYSLCATCTACGASNEVASG